MKPNRLFHRVAPLLLALALLSGAASAVEPAATHAKHYVCPPCAQACDAKVHDKPGTCPRCGMKQIEQQAAAAPAAGIDGALHVVSKLDGLGLAQRVALAGEYDWRPRASFVRAALADRLIPQVDLDALGDWDIASTEGSTDRWELVLEGRSALSAAQLMAQLGQGLEAGRWTRLEPASASAASPLRSAWRFSGRKGEPWTGVLTLRPRPGAAGQYTAKLAIARAG